MNRLQRLAEPDDYVVTLNGADRVDAGRVIATMRYEHPIYTPDVGRRAAAAAGAERRRRSRSRAPTTAGASTRTAAPPGCARRRRSGWRGDGRARPGPTPVTRTGAALYDVECATSGTPRCTATSATASTCGWSTSTRCRGCRWWLRPFAGFRARATTSATRAATDPRQPRPLPRRPRHRPARRAGAHARQRPRARARVQPAHRLLVPPTRRRRSRASSPRCTTPTASGTATCCAPTTRAGPDGQGVLRLAVPRRSTATYHMRLPEPGRAARASRSRCAATARRRSSPPSSARAPPADRRARWSRMLLRRPLATLPHVGPDPPARHRAVAAPAPRRPPTRRAPRRRDFDDDRTRPATAHRHPATGPPRPPAATPAVPGPQDVWPGWPPRRSAGARPRSPRRCSGARCATLPVRVVFPGGERIGARRRRTRR